MEDLTPASEIYSKQLEQFKGRYHSQCLFVKNPPVENLKYYFRNDGVLITKATFGKNHQSYDNRVHGGLVAAIIDASMTQCLMGHTILAYTVDLQVNYQKPVPLHKEICFQTELINIQRNRVFRLITQVFQDDQVLAEGKAKFFGEKQSLLQKN